MLIYFVKRVFIFVSMVINFQFIDRSAKVYIHHKFTLLSANVWPIQSTAIIANATSGKEAYNESFAMHTSISHVTGYRAAKFITMDSPANTAPPRILQMRPIPPTDH